MEKKIFDIDGEFFIAHIEPWSDMNGFEGEVYFAHSWENPDGDKGIHYAPDSDGMQMHENVNSDCKKAFSFLFCWRGVWEGRIYFPDENEYWSEDLKTIAGVWDELEKTLKDKIREANPDYKHFD